MFSEFSCINVHLKSDRSLKRAHFKAALQFFPWCVLLISLLKTIIIHCKPRRPLILGRISRRELQIKLAGKPCGACNGLFKRENFFQLHNKLNNDGRSHWTKWTARDLKGPNVREGALCQMEPEWVFWCTFYFKSCI